MRKIYYLLIAATLAPFLQSCPKPTTTIKEDYKVNQWVYKQMTKYYLWTEELPPFDDSEPATGTQDYFDINLRYRDNKSVALKQDYKGDRFSQIKYTGKETLSRSRATATEKEYDFGFLLSRIVNDDEKRTLKHLQVLYVMPGTPADNAGLRRGDTFDAINGTKVTNENLESLLSVVNITLGVLNRDSEEPVEVTLRKAYYYESPILLDTIYEEIEPKTAYLVYNHFTNGDKTGDAAYAEKLNAAFGRYKNAGVENLVLDLRYNGGGEVENARLLASLIAPANMIGEEFMRMQRNDAESDWEKFDKYSLFSPAVENDKTMLEKLGINSLQNADIKNIYIITSDNTASASELIIHTLRPIYREAEYVVGQTTYGKNVGSITYTNSQYEWELSPICMRVYNLDKVSGYERGLNPDTGNQDEEYMYFKDDDYYTLPPLGDYEHENLLNIVFRRFIDVPRAAGAVTKTRADDMPKPVPMVTQRGLSGGTVLID